VNASRRYARPLAPACGVVAVMGAWIGSLPASRTPRFLVADARYGWPARRQLLAAKGNRMSM
jgi:hypothetical protein